MVIGKPCNCFALMSTEEEKEIQRSVETHILSLKFLVGWQKRKKPSPGGRPGSPLDNTIWLRKSVERWQSGPLMPALSLKPLPSAAHVFTLREMRKATGNFSQDNLIGEGGFGQVFRGVLSDGKVVAVKQMDPGASARQGTQGEREFRVEVDILSRLNHPNLVRLIGYCADRTHRLLVYEYMVNGNLQELLHGVVRVKLEWHMRLRVALGAARALEYLHTGRAAGNPIIHRDFKSSNILLDEDFNPKVSRQMYLGLFIHGENNSMDARRFMLSEQTTYNSSLCLTQLLKCASCKKMMLGYLFEISRLLVTFYPMSFSSYLINLYTTSSTKF